MPANYLDPLGLAVIGKVNLGLVEALNLDMTLQWEARGNQRLVLFPLELPSASTSGSVGSFSLLQVFVYEINKECLISNTFIWRVLRKKGSAISANGVFKQRTEDILSWRISQKLLGG